MKIKPPLRALSAALCVMFSGHGFTAASNPVSTGFVDRAILETIARSRLRAGNGISIVANLLEDLNEVGVTPELAIGDLYQGGVVFYLDDTKRHGLAVGLNMAAPVFASTSPINNDSYRRMYTQANGVGAGASNTVVLSNAQSVSSTLNGFASGVFSALQNANATTGAAGACTLPQATGANGNVSAVVTDCVGGWYLPSVHEMFLLAGNLFAVNATIQQQITAGSGGALLQSGATANYWTSSTINSLTNPDSATDYPTPGQAVYYVNIGATTTTAIPLAANLWTSTAYVERWIRQF